MLMPSAGYALQRGSTVVEVPCSEWTNTGFATKDLFSVQLGGSSVKLREKEDFRKGYRLSKTEYKQRIKPPSGLIRLFMGALDGHVSGDIVFKK